MNTEEKKRYFSGMIAALIVFAGFLIFFIDQTITKIGLANEGIKVQGIIILKKQHDDSFRYYINCPMAEGDSTISILMSDSNFGSKGDTLLLLFNPKTAEIDLLENPIFDKSYWLFALIVLGILIFIVACFVFPNSVVKYFSGDSN